MKEEKNKKVEVKEEKKAFKKEKKQGQIEPDKRCV